MTYKLNLNWGMSVENLKKTDCWEYVKVEDKFWFKHYDLNTKNVLDYRKRTKDIIEYICDIFQVCVPRLIAKKFPESKKGYLAYTLINEKHPDKNIIYLRTNQFGPLETIEDITRFLFLDEMITLLHELAHHIQFALLHKKKVKTNVSQHGKYFAAIEKTVLDKYLLYCKEEKINYNRKIIETRNDIRRYLWAAKTLEESKCLHI